MDEDSSTYDNDNMAAYGNMTSGYTSDDNTNYYDGNMTGNSTFFGNT